jgi:predicted solute-binding protein
MFYGLASGKVPSGDLELVHVLSDIETLNRAAFDGKYEVTAVSFHAFAHLADKYALLPHGTSMGDNYGPIVVRNDGPSTLGVVAIPGADHSVLTLRCAKQRGAVCRSTRSSRPSSTAKPRRGCSSTRAS